MVVQLSIRKEFHAHPGRKVERGVGAHEAPRAQQPISRHPPSIHASGRVLLLVLTLFGGIVAPARTAAQPTIDHALYDTLLRRHVVDGLVDYDAFERAPAFRRYLQQLAGAELRQASEDEQLAFWINVYNAYTIALVNAHHERRSIRNINRTLGLQLKGPWTERLVRAAGRTLTLDEVEHRILRAQFHEPRLHFALVAAAKGSPPLRSEAYTGARLVAQLQDQGHRFLRERPGLNRWERNGLSLSPIFFVYFRDFANTHQEFGRWIAPWFDGEARARLEEGKYYRRQLDFDWSLNIQPPPRPTRPAPTSPAPTSPAPTSPTPPPLR